MTRTTAIAALLLLAGPASAQVTDEAPAPADPNAPAIPVVEHIPPPLPTLVGTSAQPIAPETAPQPEREVDTAPEQPPPALTLTVDRAVARRGEPFTFTVSLSSTNPSELARTPIQVTITREEKSFRTLRVARNGKVRTVLPLGYYEARASTVIPDTYAAAPSRFPRFSNGLSLRVMEPRAAAPAAAEPTPQPEPQKPAATEPAPEQKPAPVVPPIAAEPRASVAMPSTSPWLAIAIVALALIALGGAVQWVRARKSSTEQRERDESEAAPHAPRLTAKTRLTHETTLLTAPRLRFRISARAVPDKGRQHILPPSTPAPKLEDAHGRRADRP